MKFAAVLCLVLAASIGAFAEDADVAMYGGKKATTAWDIISADPNLSTLKAVVEANGLVAALDDPKRPVTVFGPTNAALAALVAALPAGTPLAGPLVTNILLQHVTRAKVSHFMRVGRSVASLNPGNSITRVASTAGKKASAWRGGQGNTVASTQTLKAKKASVIVIDGVILPNNAFASIQAIATFYNYTSFAGAVVQAGLLDAANAVSPQKTVFGPNNAAFAAVASVVATLTPEQVLAVLTYHVSPSVVATPFKATAALPTLLAGQTLGLTAPAGIVAAGSNATVMTSNIYYPGGVFQGINAVLIPAL